MNGEVMVEAWKDAKEHSHHKQIAWAKYLRMPMRRFVYIMREEGKTQAECLIEVKTRVHNALGYVPPRLDTLALIGVSAGYSEGSTMEKVKKMEEKMEDLEKVEWSELSSKDKESGSKYFQVKPDTTYILTLSSAELHRDNRWKDANGQPKLKCTLALKTVNDAPANGQIWETGSYTVMLEVRKAVQNGSLVKSKFLLKKKDAEGKITYIFEKIGESSPSSSDKVGAFL